MAKKSKRNDGSSPALTICLVFSVLMNIGMAVATFAGFSEQSALEGKLKEAKGTESSTKKARDFERFLHLKYKAALGYQLSKDDEEAFAALQKEFTNGSLGKGESNREDEEKTVRKLEDEHKFDPAKNIFSEPSAVRIRVLTEQNKGLEKQAEAIKLAMRQGGCGQHPPREDQRGRTQ